VASPCPRAWLGHLVALLGRAARTVAVMESCRAAERALVAALLLGETNTAELSGRVLPSDFTDPAAGACFAALYERAGLGGLTPGDFAALLRCRGVLRPDGYPLSTVLDWLPSTPAPAHPEAWATLVVAGSLARVVHVGGQRIVQAADRWGAGEPEAGGVLAIAVGQRASVLGALRRWDGLPRSWRDTVPTRPGAAPAGSGGRAPARASGREREVLAGLIAAPVLLERMPWLRAEDFTDPACVEVFRAVRQMHDAGRPVDSVTLIASLSQRGRSGSAAATLAAQLRPELAFPAATSFLARRLVHTAVLRETRAVGERLCDLATASAAPVGRALLTAALGEMDRLRPLAVRLHESAPAPLRTADRTSRPGYRLLPSRPARAVPERHAG
jgi:hypothetical protein